MSDVLLQSAIKENDRLVRELIEVRGDIAEARASKYTPTLECDMHSIETYRYLQLNNGGSVGCFATLGMGNHPTRDWFQLQTPYAKVKALNDIYCRTFGCFTSGRRHGFFCMDLSFGRCGNLFSWTVPACVNKVMVQMWGPGTGSSGFCCQGTATPGTAGAYTAFQLAVTPGDTLCFCYACAYCCFPGGTSQPGYSNSLCTSLCYCDTTVPAAYSFFAFGGPEPHVCRSNCAYQCVLNYGTCCSLQFGNRFGFTSDFLETNVSSICAHGGTLGNSMCMGGIASCSGCWSICYDSATSSPSYHPAFYDYACGFGNTMTLEQMRTKKVKQYGVFGMWPELFFNQTCCLGNPSAFGDQLSYILQPPVVGFPNSFHIDTPFSSASIPRNAKSTGFTCCTSGGLTTAQWCHGIMQAPSVGGMGTFGIQPGWGCGEPGGGGAVCVSWNFCNDSKL